MKRLGDLGIALPVLQLIWEKNKSLKLKNILVVCWNEQL